MIRSISLLIMFLFVSSSCFGQDVFNLENSRKFAKYLYDSGQFDLAADEYERVVFLDRNDSLSIFHLISAYRLQKNYEIGLKRAMALYPDSQKLTGPILREFFLTSILAKNFNYANSLVRDNVKLDNQESTNYALSLLVLEKRWDDARDYIEQKPEGQSMFYNTLGSVVFDQQHIKRKNPFVAGTLSTLIPGLGKVYTKDWKDGLVSLLFVASNVWQAYRGFSENGVKSTYGWIFGTIAGGFWVGNIYGSVKSAKDYNQRQEKFYYENASQIIYNGL